MGKDIIDLKRKEGKIWSHIREKWLDETPEERVRQEYLCVLVNEYGFSVDQIAEEEELTGRGSAQARADFVIWKTFQDKADSKNPLIIVECKSDNVTIKEEDYYQGDHYARITNAPFFVTHNNQETKFWKVLHDKMPKSLQEIENIPHADASDKEIDELIKKLKIFKEDEFAKLLHECHNIIRNREKKDPAAAFDEIAKILFIKVDIERRLKQKRTRKNLFTADFLDEQTELYSDPINVLFDQTKKDYKEDKIFEEGDIVNLKYNTAREIVKKLERYNLSETSEDIKGIAFERFLGRTFRGEIGQFFTPRTIVEFMIRILDPKEGDIICDPASGSGGFLIRFFEIVRQQILADADREYKEYKKDIDANSKLSNKDKALQLRKKYDEIQVSIDQMKKNSRLWKLANRCIYGCDANDRMARTSKMNMIMHGDGHGGVHHHDGFINVNGIFEERFDIVLTNPPFGANVEPSDIVLESEVTVSEEDHSNYKKLFGDAYEEAQSRVKAAKGKPIASLFDLPKSPRGKIKTEILFLERCLELLKPGGKLGIVLPEGVFNNPTLDYVREFCEDRAYIRAVVSLPQETFFSIGANVKASLLFMQKFTESEKKEFDAMKLEAEQIISNKYVNEIEEERERYIEKIDVAKKAKDVNRSKALQKELSAYEKKMKGKKRVETRNLLKKKFSYSIFIYDAEKVGITATGEYDLNELYPSDNIPEDIEKTCLELYREFLQNSLIFVRKD